MTSHLSRFPFPFKTVAYKILNMEYLVVFIFSTSWSVRILKIRENDLPKQNSVFLTTRLQPLQDHKPFETLIPFQPPRPPKLSLKKLQSNHWNSAPWPRVLTRDGCDFVCFVWLVWKVALVDAFQLATCKLLLRSAWATPIKSACYAGQEICIVTYHQYSCSCNT